MRYSYDNSLDGLFTVIFEQYRHIENSIIVVKSEQLDFLNDDIYIETNTDKSSRVKKSIIDKFGFNFYRSITTHSSQKIPTNRPLSLRQSKICTHTATTSSTLPTKSLSNSIVCANIQQENFTHIKDFLDSKKSKTTSCSQNSNLTTTFWNYSPIISKTD